MKGNIIQYNFLRMEDKDFYAFDYSIVLEDKGDMLTILPFNNKFAKDSISTFCLGKIDGFLEIRNEGFIENAGQYVHFEKMMDVPKADVHMVYKQDINGGLLKDENGEFIPITLSDEQNEMIAEKHELYEEGEAKTPLSVKQDINGGLLKDENGEFIPITLSDEQNEMIAEKHELYEEGEAKTPLSVIFKADKSFKLDYNSISSKELLELGNTEFDRYREFNFGDEKVLLFFIDEKRYSIIMRKGHTLSREERNSALAVHFNIA